MKINRKAKILIDPHKGKIVYGIYQWYNSAWGIVVPELNDEFFAEGNKSAFPYSFDGEYENLNAIFYDNGEEVQIGDRVVGAFSRGSLRVGVVDRIDVGCDYTGYYKPTTFLVKFFGEKRRKRFYPHYHHIKKISEIIDISESYDDQGNLI